VASFQDSNTNMQASQFTATITWGDGTQSSGTVSGSNGTFTVLGTHTYAVDSIDQPGGVYPVTVTITDPNGNTLTGNGAVTVVRPQMIGLGNELAGPPGTALNNVQVGEFMDPSYSDGVSEFSAAISWGDGTSSMGSIVELGPGLFAVLGSHSYAAAGPYTIQVEISQNWNSILPFILLTSTAVIGAAPAQISGPSVVPGNSVYRYTVPIPPTSDLTKLELGNFTADNTKVADPVRQGVLPPTINKDGVKTYTGVYVDVRFKNQPAIVKIQLPKAKVNGVAFNPKAKSVTVVMVGVEAPSAPLKPFVVSGGAGTAKNGNNVYIVGQVLGKTAQSSVWQSTSYKTPAKPPFPSSINWAAKVVLTAPAGNADAVSQIHVGFVSHIHIDDFYYATYLEKNLLTANKEYIKRSSLNRHTYLDSSTPNTGQYAYTHDNENHAKDKKWPPAIFADAAARNTSDTIQDYDMPRATFNEFDGGNQAIRLKAIFEFTVDVAAETIDTREAGPPVPAGGVGGQQLLYFPEAKAAFLFSVQAELQGAVWKSTGGSPFDAVPFPFRGDFANWASYGWYTSFPGKFVPENISSPTANVARLRMTWT
jgi:hypothetical protein